MKILVSMRVCENSSYKEIRDAISHDWFSLFNELNVLPILIPNNTSDIKSYFDITDIRGVLLTGGNDILDEKSTPSLQRNEVERQLLDIAIKYNTPVLGVCRGLQMINHYFGGTLSKINSELHVNKSHKVILKNLHFDFPIAKEIKVNSYHDFGINESGLSDALVPFAISEDGLIEAARHRSFNIQGVQWHPERENLEASLFDLKLLRNWLKI